jgi:hypothetical protein
MKLKVTDWKHAWFESHISERFFLEMTKLEKGSVLGLETTAQWMEQIMIEVGLLAQAMIRLEQQGAPEPQIRTAYDKSIRVAALAMHLITALDGTDREQIRSASIVRGEHGEWSAPRAAPAAAAAPAPLPAPPPPRQPAAPQPAPPASAPAPAAPAASGATGAGTDTAATTRLLNRGPLQRPPLNAPRERTRAPQAEATEHTEPAAAPSEAPIFSQLLQISGRAAPRSESQVHQTIVSLAEQGLSRAEIEVVTGEPRHIVEAVLKHARSTRPPGAQQA